MQFLPINETEVITGGTWGHVAVAIAIADAAYEFYKDYSENRI
ncbi:hypothetical protein OPS25_02825 [Alteromonas ponticola]|uniref:Uncharacterized protein n=1 Tax=Alteromonas aquimaris TaxID=2998417 RepID=A0ABT3P3T7_9ALTE|nr:hypothetical protein [Alteromonas aquimaris]MCW8107436.1 hypothetical protein [Alteromonas aquimaris]